LRQHARCKGLAIQNARLVLALVLVRMTMMMIVPRNPDGSAQFVEKLCVMRKIAFLIIKAKSERT
jgi:hypothetical protein